MNTNEQIVWQVCLKAGVDLVNKEGKTPSAILKEVRTYRDNLFLDFKTRNNPNIAVNAIPKDGSVPF